MRLVPERVFLKIIAKKTGPHASRKPCRPNPRSECPKPSWKIHFATPKAAPVARRFATTAAAAISGACTATTSSVVKEPSRADRRVARELPLKRQRLLGGLRAEPRKLVAQQPELARSGWPVATRYATADERAVGLFVGGVVAEHLLPTALGAHRCEVALTQPRTRKESPRFV